MNARAILDSCLPASWRSEPAKPKKQFPAEAYDYAGPIDKEVVAKIQEEANKVLDKQQWTVIERLGDGPKR